jgi:hypothetical protein
MAPPEVTYAALKSVNLADIRCPLTRALLAIRLLAVRRSRRRLGLEPLPVPAKITLENVEDYGQIKLAEKPGAELAVGAIARFWSMESLFERRTPAEFKTFDCPGHIKAVAGFLVMPFGEKRSLLSYEMRIRATDTPTRRRLFFWFNLEAPLTNHSMRCMLKHVKAAAERHCATPSRRRGA